jgi:hypothetical protein
MTVANKEEQELSDAKQYFADKDRNLLLSPPLKRAAYSDRMAWTLASLAQLVYDRFEDDKQVHILLVEKLKSGGFRLLDEFNDPATDTQGFLVANIKHEYAVLAFRGTEVTKKRDVATDAMVLKISNIETKVRVHTGFNEAYESVSGEIEASLAKHLKDMPLYVTGHSLGAALATVAVRHLEKKTYFKDQIAACYTFGSPRVGNKALDKELRSPVYRVVNTTDIVTMVPSIGYYHVGDVRFLERTGVSVLRSIPITERILLVFRAVLIKLFSTLVGDHAIAEYRRKLENIARLRNDNKMTGR